MRNVTEMLLLAVAAILFCGGIYVAVSFSKDVKRMDEASANMEFTQNVITSESVGTCNEPLVSGYDIFALLADGQDYSIDIDGTVYSPEMQKSINLYGIMTTDALEKLYSKYVVYGFTGEVQTIAFRAN